MDTHEDIAERLPLKRKKKRGNPPSETDLPRFFLHLRVQKYSAQLHAIATSLPHFIRASPLDTFIPHPFKETIHLRIGL